jgi:hypothetical protein
LIALPGLLALAFAFGRLGGRRYETWITIIWRYLRQPKIAVWQRLPPATQAQEETPVSSPTRESEA